MTKRAIFGLSAALVSPFRSDGAVDLPRLVAHGRWVLDNGCDTLTLFGTTGEGFGIDMPDRAAMMGALAGAGIDFSGKVYAAVASATVDGAAEQARLALGFGARGLLFTPPFYMKGMDDEGLFAWFARSFERIGPALRGVILYHIPGQTAVPLSVDLVGRLKQAFPGAIAGVKDSSGDWATAQAFLQAHGELSILVGDERLLARAMRAGAEGSICGLANFAPSVLRPVIHGGRDEPRVTELVDLVLRYPVLPAVKALVGHVHGDAGYGPMRPPVTDLDAGARARLAAAFDAIMTRELAA